MSSLQSQLQLQDEALNIIRARLAFSALTLIFLTISLTLDWVCPPWLKFVIIAMSWTIQCGSAYRYLKDAHASREMCAGVLALMLACVPLYYWLVPRNRMLVIYRWLVDCVFGVIRFKVEFYQFDGPPDQQSVRWIKQRDAAIVYTATAVAIIYRSWFVSAFLWYLQWVLMPLVTLFFTYLVLVSYIAIPNFIVDTLNAWPRGLAWITNAIMTQSDLWRNYLFNYIPREVTRWAAKREQLLRTKKSVPLYAYESLGDGQIRLLVLERRDWLFGGSIRANMFNTSLATAAKYEAISYRWGSPERTQEILVDGFRFPVTESAFDVLLTRRSVWRQRVLWLDAICINQSDSFEKASQVSMMAQIYHHAGRVVMVPQATILSSSAVALIYEIASGPYIFDLTTAEINKTLLGDLYTPQLRALLDLLTDEYFTRAWVIQEIAIGNNVQLFYGGRYVPISLFCDAVRRVLDQHSRHLLTRGIQLDKRGLSDGSTLENILAMESFRADSPSVVNHRESTRLENVLFTASSFNATDPRDMIFAVLGLAKFEPDDLVAPAYWKSPEEVFADAATYLFLRQYPPAIKLLALAGIGTSVARLKVPSWVPVFSERRPGTNFLLTDATRSDHSHRAAGETTPEIRPGPVLRSIQVRGVLSNHIAMFSEGCHLDVGGTLSGADFEDSAMSRRKYDFVNAAMHLFCRQKRYWPLEEGVEQDQFWLALIADRYDRKWPVETAVLQIARTWYRFVELAMAAPRHHMPIEATVKPHCSDEEWDLWEQGAIQGFDANVVAACYGKRFGMTAHGMICLVPPLSWVGDRVFIPSGAQTPFLVRGAPGGAYELVGEAYVQGAMMGAEFLGKDLTDVVLI